MEACTFFGHRESPDEVFAILKETIEKLITENKVTEFYVGNQGNFDRLAYKALKELSISIRI